ncbi:retrotransposon protein, putative, ty1-copia subclass [Tanacetum coccineum]
MAQPDNNTLSSAFKTFFEREKLTGKNFNDWYRSLRIVLRVAGTYEYLYKPLPEEPPETAAENIKAAWKTEYKIHSDVACLMLGRMSPALQRQFELYFLQAMLDELRRMFEKPKAVEIYDLVDTLHSCKQAPGKSISAHVLEMKETSICIAWGRQLAHIGKTRMQKLQREGLLESINDESYDKCESCISGKMTKKPFNNNIERATDLLGLIHTDVCGPLRHVSRKGASYFLTFTDDFSHYGYVYLLKHKHEVFETFKVFKSEVELQLGKKIKALRSDRGGEYLSQEFKEYLADIRAIRILIAIAAYYDYEIWQMDVKTAFLNGRLDEDIYMEQPEGYVNPKYPNRVCKLQRSIYGLKQASRQWNKRFDEEIKKFGFTQNRDEPCVYRKASGSNVVFLILYVDDILIMGNNIPRLKEVKDYLGKCFSMKDLGEAAYILGIKIYRDRSKRLIGLSQSAYIDKILKKFNMHNSKKGYLPMEVKHELSNEMCASTPEEVAYMKKVPYASAVGSIMYAVRCTRPDVAFAQNLVSRYQQNPGKLHWVAVKHILKYLRNTRDMFLVYGGKPDTELNVTGFCDASWQSDKDDTKSQTGYVFVVNGGAVDWKSKKQTTIAMSATQAEYMAASEAAMEAVWIRKFVGDLGVMPSIKKPIDMYCDNSAAIIFANDSGVMKGARHFLRRYHYVREQVESGEIKILKVHTYDNLADPFTKALPLPRGKVTDHANGIGL